MVNCDIEAHLRFPGCVAYTAQLIIIGGTQAKMLNLPPASNMAKLIIAKNVSGVLTCIPQFKFLFHMNV